MASPKVRFAFSDGTEEVVTYNPGLMLQIERKFGSEMPPIEGQLYGAWHKLGRPGKFDDWVETIEEMGDIEGVVDPTQLATPDGS